MATTLDTPGRGLLLLYIRRRQRPYYHTVPIGDYW